MAQRTEKEETEFKAVPETITPCVNNCGVTGNHHATNNMCQNCFTATSSAAAAAAAPLKFASVVGEKTGGRSPSRSPRRSSNLESRIPIVQLRTAVDRSETASAKREVNRCSGCRRKVGLTGFRCRCGDLYCSEHRYSDRHDCSYDYKTAGREAIAMENPVVKAAKIVRI